jgi:uncharacterized protein YceH (UPF0502 family)
VDGDFDPTERRVVGVLIEKALSTPDYYPMTVNALVAACNQKNNRDPVTSYVEFEIEGALRALFDKKWVAYVEGGGRVRKWKHRLDERLGVSPTELAVLAELLLRGAQQPGELRARSARMANIPTQEALMEILDGLGKRLPPLVVKLPRVPGERADRYGQTLAPDGPAATAAPAPSPAPRPATPEPEAPSSAAGSLAERIERLERDVAEIRSQIETLKGPGA